VRKLYILKGLFERAIKLKGKRARSASVLIKIIKSTRLTMKEEEKIINVLRKMNRAFKMLEKQYYEIAQVWDLAIINHKKYVDVSHRLDFNGNAKTLKRKVSYRVKKGAYLLTDYLNCL
jgi:type III secretion system FlhB-like substrate exporter